jgi:hypothetical protein
MPRRISTRFLDNRTGLVHIGEANERDDRSEWTWFACGAPSSFCYATAKEATCMNCVAGIPLFDWMTGK